MSKIAENSKRDFFGKEKQYKEIYSKITQNTYFKFKENNQIVKLFLDAKTKGNYKRIIFDVNKPNSTCYRDTFSLKKLEVLLNKPFQNLVLEDIDKLQEMLNKDDLMRPKIKNSDIDRPLSYAYKRGLVKELKQFWKFYRLYANEELKKELPDITEYLRLRKPINYNGMIDFFSFDDLRKMVALVKEPKMKACLMVGYDTGGRVIELLNLKRNNCYLDEKNKTWNVILPQLKGKSSNKFAIELILSSKEFDAWIKENNFKPDEYMFDYKYDYFRKVVGLLSKKVLGRRITPKIFRKSCTMHLINEGYSEQYIKAHLGHSAGSKELNAYTAQYGIKRPDELRQKDKSLMLGPDLENDLLHTKEQLKVQEFKIKELSSISQTLLDAISRLEDVKIQDNSNKKLVEDLLKALKQ